MLTKSDEHKEIRNDIRDLHEGRRYLLIVGTLVFGALIPGGVQWNQPILFLIAMIILSALWYEDTRRRIAIYKRRAYIQVFLESSSPVKWERRHFKQEEIERQEDAQREERKITGQVKEGRRIWVILSGIQVIFRPPPLLCKWCRPRTLVRYFNVLLFTTVIAVFGGPFIIKEKWNLWVAYLLYYLLAFYLAGWYLHLLRWVSDNEELKEMWIDKWDRAERSLDKENKLKRKRQKG